MGIIEQPDLLTYFYYKETDMVLLAGGSLTGLIPQIPTITPPNISSCVPDILGLLQGPGIFQNPLSGPIVDLLGPTSIDFKCFWFSNFWYWF